MPSPPSDGDLIRACRAGSNAGWEALIEKYGRLVQSVPLRLGLSPADAADVTQQTFIIFLEGVDHFRDEGSLPAWLTTVARRQAWRMLGKQKRQVSIDAGQEGVHENEAARALGLIDADQMQRWEVTAWVDQALGQLNDKCRSLLMALYLDITQPTYEEVAQRFDMPLGSIGPTRARCLDALMKVLARD